CSILGTASRFLCVGGDAAPPARPLERQDLPPRRLHPREARRYRRGAPEARLSPARDRARERFRQAAAASGSMKVGVSTAAVCILLVGIPACPERGRPDPRIQMAIPHSREEAAATGRAQTPSVPSRLEVPPAVLQAYSGLRLKWKDSSNGQEGTIEMPLGKTAPIPGSDLSVRADAFLPSFAMSAEAI